jgi:hypothetical protein
MFYALQISTSTNQQLKYFPFWHFKDGGRLLSPKSENEKFLKILDAIETL